MSASSAAGKSRRRPASPARARSRSRARKPNRPWRIPPLLWELAPLLLALVAFLLAFILDPPAVGHLVWACVSGRFGEPVQIAASAGLLSLVGATAWAFRPTTVPASGKQPARRPRQRARVPAGDRPSGGDVSQDDASPPRRRTRTPGTAKAATDAPDGESPRPSGRPAPTNRLARERDGDSKPRRSRIARAPADHAASEPDEAVGCGKT
jgi:hypothetical protein